MFLQVPFQRRATPRRSDPGAIDAVRQLTT